MLFLLRRGRFDRDLGEEMRFHLELAAEDRAHAGLDREAARGAARFAFGNVTRTRDRSIEVWARPFESLETCAQDVRFALRTLWRHRRFSVAALAILALGIGAVTAISSVADGVLLRPLPYREPGGLVRIFGAWEYGAREGISPPDFVDYRGANTIFESLAAASNTTPLLNLKGPGEPEQIRSRNVTAGFFRALGVQPLAGREFLPEDETWRGPRVAILSHGLWQRQFGGDPAVIGARIAINAQPYTIVGLLPPFFDFLGATEVFTPLQPNPAPELRATRSLIAIGRLRAGVTLEEARSEMSLLARRLETEHAKFDRGWGVVLLPLRSEIVREVRPALLLLLGASGFVLLIVSVNVAGLMVSLAATRAAEIAVRVSLGATRGRIARQLVTESLVLALAGGLLGCPLAGAGIDLIRGLAPAGIPRLAEVGVDLRMLAFALVLSCCLGILVALEPALRIGRTDLAPSLKSDGRATTAHVRLRSTLVVAEVGLSVILLVGAGLLIRSLLHLGSVDPGFRAARTLTTRIALPPARYNDPTAVRLGAVWRDLLDRVEGIPGVAGAAVTSELPLSGLNNPTPKMATTADGRSYLIHLRSVSPSYWRVMGIPLGAGRPLARDDRWGTPRVVVINEEFRRDAFGGRDPIGERLTFNFAERSERENYQAVIVGVAASTRHVSLAAPAFREAYLPIAQSPLLNYDLVLRTTSDARSIAPALRETIGSFDPELALGPMRTLEDVVDLGLAPPRFRAVVLTVFAGVAVALAATALYGLLSHLVSQRTREIGVRMALGAAERDIHSLILGEGARLAAAGVAWGILAAAALTHTMSRLIFGVAPLDLWSFVLGAATLLAAALTASYFPARRAARTDPMEALRHE